MRMNQLNESSLKVLLNMFGGLKKSVGIMPKFSGEDGLSADEFIVKFEEYCCLNSYSENTKMQMIVLCFDGEAFWWFEEIKTEVGNSWSCFKKLFGEYYSCEFICESEISVCDSKVQAASVFGCASESQSGNEYEKNAVLASIGDCHLVKGEEIIIHIDNIRVKVLVGYGSRNYVSRDFLGRVNKELYSLVDSEDDKCFAGVSHSCVLPVEFRDGSIVEMVFYVKENLSDSVLLCHDDVKESETVPGMCISAECCMNDNHEADYLCLFGGNESVGIIQACETSILDNSKISLADNDDDDYSLLENQISEEAVVVSAQDEISGGDDCHIVKGNSIADYGSIVGEAGTLNLECTVNYYFDSKNTCKLVFPQWCDQGNFRNCCDYKFWFGMFSVMNINYVVNYFIRIILMVNVVFDRGKLIMLYGSDVIRG